ncbi:filamentous hemagglutinin family protein, partial [Paraburkholderia sp. GAS448]|uniref:two-partner secretion domain-containing protein n=1 Tax=Paraburkholderia sp. GAS448 TaxID=3035136 RepID=UPI003D22D442
MRTTRLARITVATAATLFALAGPALAAGIVPDGGTATSVSTGANGHQTVNIAPAFGGVSHNTYSAFNVGKPGADLNNTGINAQTIVNQVTSTNPSLIQGAIGVLGPRANVILANPNGITVDGGSFVNAGHVVLSTGQVSFNDLTLPGGTQRNVVLTTNGGTITIGAGGLSGTLVNLDLVAKQLAVNGPVTNDYTSSTGGVRAIVGDSTTTWDTGYSPTDNGHDWLTGLTSPGASSSGIAVDITALGGMTAGRVELVVTDKGAGVHSLGALYATAGDVVVSANGDVGVIDSSVKAAGNVSLSTSGALSLQGAQVSAANNVTVNANGIALTDDATGPSTLSAGNAVSLTSAGDISNTGSVIQAGALSADGTPVGDGLTLNAGGSIVNRSTGANLGVIFAQGGVLSLNAAGDITNENARLLGNQAVNLTAQGDVSNIIDHTDGVDGGAPVAYSSTGGNFLFFTHTTSGFDVDYGTVSQPDQLALIASTGGPVTISGRNVSNTGGLIQTNDGDISITAQQAFTNAAVFAGQASYSRGCWIVCHASASSNVTPYGGTIQSGADISITAGTSAANIGGNVFAGGNISVIAPVTYAQGVTGYSAINQDRGFKAFFGSTWAQILATDVGGGFAADGLVTLVGDGVIDGGYISGGKGTSATDHHRARAVEHAGADRPAPGPDDVVVVLMRALVEFIRAARWTLLLAVAALVAAIFLNQRAYAQTVPGAPPVRPVQDPAQQLIDQQRARARQQQLNQPPASITLPAPEAGTTLEIPPDTPVDQIAETGPTFQVSRIVLGGPNGSAFVNPTGVPQATLDAIIAPFTGHALGAHRINVLLKRLTDAFVSAGYVTTRALLGPQNLGTATLTVTVQVGRIEAFTVNGRPIQRLAKDQASAGGGWLTDAGYQNAFPAAPGDALNLGDLDQGVAQINRLRRNQAQVQILPGQSPGDSVVAIANQPGDRLYTTLGVDNYGSSATGVTR